MLNNNDNILDWRLASYGKIIRGDDDTSEDEVAEAIDSEVARRLAICWNICAGYSTDDLENYSNGIPFETSELYRKIKNKV